MLATDKPLRLVQTPAPTSTQPQPGHRDRSRHPHHDDALRAAWQAGELTGQRRGYTQGWRFGLLCGASACCAGAALCTALAIGAHKAGLLPW